MASVSSSASDDVVVIERDDISNYNPEQILPESPEEIKKIEEWLKPTDYALESGEYRKHLAAHMAGTGSWLTSSSTYQKWLTSKEHGMLWIKGIPGSGKSVVAAHLIDQLSRSSPEVPVLYFFFRQIIDANHAPAALLRDWLHQILQYSPPLQKQLKELLQARRSIHSMSMEDLWKNLRLALIGLPGKAFCVADALDEMDQGNDQFLQALGALGRLHPNKIKVLVTSRPVPSVERPLRKCETLHIRLEENMVDVDISKYVEHGLESSAIPMDEQDLIRTAIPGRANGLFLYAKLALDAFLEPGARTKEVLRTLPVDLHEMYANLLHEHARRSGVPDDVQLLILQWVTHATRPLRLLELAEMINVVHRQGDKQNLEATKNLVRAAVGPLLEILPDETVCVIHHSFTEYLKCMTRSEDDHGYPILRFGSTHNRLALACLQYLQSGCLDLVKVPEGENDDMTSKEIRSSYRMSFENARPDPLQNAREQQHMRLQYPFVAYAAANWHVHAERAATADFPQDEVKSALDLFLGHTRRRKAWLKIQWAPDDQCACKGVTPLHIAARYGLRDYARYLIASQAGIQACDVYGKTPIWWAATGGYADVIRVLVEAGADPDKHDEVSGLKPLHQAAKLNHAGAVRAILEAGVSPLTIKTRENPGRWCGNAPRTKGHTPLMYACHNGHLEALNEFLPFLTDVDTVHRALAWSARRGHSKLVERILQHPGVNVNAKIRGETPLYLACADADLNTIACLLEAGADPTILCPNSGPEFGGAGSFRLCSSTEASDEQRGLTALYALCTAVRSYPTRFDLASDVEKLHEMFSLLVKKGANVQQQTHKGETPLHAAVNSPVLVRLLLRAGADANAVDDDGLTPLHLAMLPESVALLVEEGNADINKLSRRDKIPPILYMLQQPNRDMILELLEYGPDLTIKDKKGNGPLHEALLKHDSDDLLVKALLSRGADPNGRNRKGRTPLSVMCFANEESIKTVDMLLEAGADINAKDATGKTVIFWMINYYSRYGRSEYNAMKALFEKGADLNARDFRGRTLLHHAVENYEATTTAMIGSGEKFVSRFDFLVSMGLDVRAVDYYGNTLIHELALRSEVQDTTFAPKYDLLWEQLLAHGIDLDQENHQGRTALHILAAPPPSQRESLRGPRFKAGSFSALSFVISKCQDINHADHQGLTALHLTATVSASSTKKLLAAGANPAVTMVEGLTPLHLAARARQSNIVGMLIEAVKHTNADTINAQDEKGHTPLYYACLSGRVESVRLLLDGGADTSKGNLFEACAAFETEDKLWDEDFVSSHDDFGSSAKGLTLEDKTRPIVPDINVGHFRLRGLKDTVRLDEIVDMLVDKGCCNIASPDLVTDAQHEYTLACLIRAQAWQPAHTISHSPATSPPGEIVVKRPSDAMYHSPAINLFAELELRMQQDAQLQAVNDSPHFEEGKSNIPLIRYLLKKRQYHVMEALFHKGVDFLAPEGPNNQSALDLFVHHGFANLLERIGTLEAERHLPRGKWHAFGDKTKPGLYAEVDKEDLIKSNRYHSFLLSIALMRELPNMDVVRVLVEKFHVDVNQFRYASAPSSNGGYDVERQENMLHYLAPGLYWWHVALALPYLISRGADVNSRNQAGQTPLHCALQSSNDWIGIFHKDAAKVLVTAGADVNAVDGKGISCLGYAGKHADLVRLLVDNGATITADALLGAIQGKSVDVLKALLDAGADPNMRCEAPEPAKGTQSRRGHRDAVYQRVLPHEQYPLYNAAINHMQYPGSPKDEKKRDLTAALQLVEILLAAGANPYAQFKRINIEYVHSHPEEGEIGEEGEHGALAFRKKTSQSVFEDVVILHDLLERNDVVHPILTVQNLDPNVRDTRGRTALHVACHNRNGISAPINALQLEVDSEVKSTLPSFLDHLISCGADLLAVDREGRNMLHHMFESKKRRFDPHPDIDTMARLAKQHSTLLSCADSYGKTPLHLALRHAVLELETKPAEVLLEAGADPFVSDNEGNGALHILAYRLEGSAEVRALFAKLLDRGLDINARNNRGETPVFNPAKRLPPEHQYTPLKEAYITFSEAIATFEQAGADLFARDKRGRGLLHAAAKGSGARGTPPITRQARLFFENKLGTSPESIFELLLQKGLDPMMEDDQKRTALDVAAACGNEGVLKLFGRKVKP